MPGQNTTPPVLNWSIEQEPDNRWIARRGSERETFDTEQEARSYAAMADKPRAMQDFQTKTTTQMANARAIIVATGETNLISLGGGIPALIDGTADGAIVGDSTWTKERAQEVSALWSAFNVWLSTPITDATAHGKPPIAILTAYD